MTPASSSTRTQSLSSGIRTRLTTKPGVSEQRIGVLPSFSPSSNAVSRHRLGGPLGPHDLDERHERRRVEEVHPDRTLGSLEHGRDLGHRERRGVRGQDRVVANDCFEGAEELVLDSEILECRLDHDVAGCEVGEVGREDQARDRRVARCLVEPALLDLAGQEVRDLVARLPPPAAGRPRGRPSRSRTRSRAGRCPSPSSRGRRPRSSQALDDSGDRHPEADAHRRDAVARLTALELGRSSVAVIRAPVAPSGCPSEMPPPFGFTSSIRSSRCEVLRRLQHDGRERLVDLDHAPCRPSSGPLSRRRVPSPAGCRAASASDRHRRCRTTTKRARGSSPSRATAASLAISTAAEPSTICDELPAVTTPSGPERRLRAPRAPRPTSRGAAPRPPRTPPGRTRPPRRLVTDCYLRRSGPVRPAARSG